MNTLAVWKSSERLMPLNHLFPLVKICPKYSFAKKCLWALMFYLKSIRNDPELYLIEVVSDFMVAVFAVKVSNLPATNS